MGERAVELAAYPIATNGAMYDPAQAEEYVRRLFGNVAWQPGQLISILGIGEKGTPREGEFSERQMIAPAFPSMMHRHLKRWAEWHVAGFIVPAVLHPQAAEAGDVTLDKVAALTAIVLDLDAGDVTEKARYASARLGPPSMIVASGGKTDAGKLKSHLYWTLDMPAADVERVAALRKQLAAKVGGDQSFGRATQVVRIPGSVHAKHGLPSVCHFLDRQELCYSLDDLAEKIESMEPMPGCGALQVANSLVTSGMMDFTPRQDTAIAALHRDVHAGGDELNRWGEFSKVAGFHISEIRAGRMTPHNALTATSGWVLSHMNPPWPQARIDQEFRALLNKDIANHGPFPDVSQTQQLPVDLWPVQHTPSPPPEFPREVLGPVWSEWVLGAAGSTGSPRSYVGLSLLLAAAALIGNARRVTHGSWSEPCILWGMMVGDPSTGKTPALRPIHTILSAFDRDLSAGFPEAQAAHVAKEATAKLAKENWEKLVKAAMAKGEDAPPMPKSTTIPTAPVCPAIVVKDVTPEKLGYLSNASPKGLIMIRDEAAGWLGNMNRFSGGGERQVWLEAYNGDVGKIDRVKLDSPIHIDHFSVSVLGGIQPDRLDHILRDDPDDGLIARFLFVYPEPVPPRRAARWVPDFDPVALMRRLYSLQLVVVDEALEPQRLPLTEEAADRFEDWRQLHYPDSQTVHGMVSGSWGKMPGQLLRLALVLEFLNWTGRPEEPEPTFVTEASISGAIELIDAFFKPMTRRVLGGTGGSQKIHATKLLAAYIVQTRPTTLDTRPVMNGKGCPTLLRKPEHMDPACAELVDAGWLRPVSVRAGGSKGKLPKAFDVSPELWSALDALPEDSPG